MSSIFDIYKESCVRSFDLHENNFSHELLNTFIAAAGYEYCVDPSYDWHGLKRGNSDLIIIQHTLSGSGNLMINDQYYEIASGHTMLLRIPQNSRYWLGDNSHWKFFWVTLGGHEIVRLFDSLLLNRGPVQSFNHLVIKRMELIVHEILTETSSTTGHLSAKAYELTMALFDATSMEHSSARDPDAMDRVKMHIEQNLDQEISMSDLAKIANYSRPYFTQVFTQLYGESPASYLLRLRLEKSRELLALSRYNIKYISHACGFKDPNYFARRFRHQYGMSPRQFRSLNNQQLNMSRQTV
ncbi:AraC family transcriptional regulator [Gynuella sp.]|uniref:helix-turn-helix domain-containing protein n=1 Tax=Gynuella sp. TaxID=2969146 RepID=UPI003D0B695D